MYNQRDGSLKALGIITFLVWPFGSLLMALHHYKKPVSKWFFILGLTFLGYNIGLEGDLERYHEKFFEILHYSWSDVIALIISFGDTDFYILLIAKIVQTFAGSVNMYFAILMFIFAYYYISIIQLIVSKLPKHILRNIMLLVIAFATYHSIRFFISLRFYTAVLIYVYSVLQIILNKNKKYIVLACLTPLIHVAFWIAMPLLPMYFVLKNKVHTAILMVVVTFVVGQTSIVSFVEKTAGSAEVEAINKKVETYASDDGRQRLEKHYEQADKSHNLKLTILNSLRTVSYYYVMLGLGMLYLIRKKIEFRETYMNFFVFCLLLWSVTNIMLNVSNGFRFLHLMAFSGLSFILLIYADNFKKNKLLEIYVQIGAPFIILLNAMTLYAANPLFKPEFFFSNYFIEIVRSNIN